jgi:hypothetical protein
MAENPEKATKLSHDDDLDGRTEIGNPSFEGDAAHAENIDADQLRANINAKIANPLAGYSHAQCMYKGQVECLDQVNANFTFCQ